MNYSKKIRIILYTCATIEKYFIFKSNKIGWKNEILQMIQIITTIIQIVLFIIIMLIAKQKIES